MSRLTYTWESLWQALEVPATGPALPDFRDPATRRRSARQGRTRWARLTFQRARLLSAPLRCTQARYPSRAVLTLSLVTLGCATASPQQASEPSGGAQCAGLHSVDSDVAVIYGSGAVTQVTAVYHTDFRARAIQPRYVVGARFDVPAPRDMSAAYVEWALSCHAESASLSHPNDPVRVSGVHDVSVRAVGSSLRIAVTGADRTAGAAILERARALQRSGGSVQARQAADLGTDGPTL